MTRRFAAWTICLMLLLLPALSASAQAPENINQIAENVLNSDAPFKRQSIKSKYKSFVDLGVTNEILGIWGNNDGYVFWAKVDYGADYYEAPSLETFIGLRKDGTVSDVQIANFYEHTQQFVDMITPDYIKNTYQNQFISPSFDADAVTGATFTSQAVLYSVRLASYYASNVFNIGDKGDTDLQLKKLMSAVPGRYEKVEVNDAFTVSTGSIEYLAQGATDNGIEFAALVVSCHFVPEDPNNNMILPTYQIWINTDTHQVFHAKMLTGRFYEGFELPDDKLTAYYSIPIADEMAYYNFSEGLVTDAPDYVVTSATASFPDTATGSTPEGNDTSRAVQNCFITAAQYYLRYLK